ncbi:MAG: hypothetical protein ACI8O8_003203, partial [Oleiphilaceae bacterium]
TKARLGESAVGPVCADCGPLAPLIVTSAIRPKQTKYQIMPYGENTEIAIVRSIEYQRVLCTSKFPLSMASIT